MTSRTAVLISIASALLATGCDGKSETDCGNTVLKGNFTPIGQAVGDPVVSVAIATAAKTTRSSAAVFSSNYLGYEGKTRSDGSRCFHFVPKSCVVGGNVTMCVTPSLEPRDVTAAE